MSHFHGTDLSQKSGHVLIWACSDKHMVCLAKMARSLHQSRLPSDPDWEISDDESMQDDEDALDRVQGESCRVITTIDCLL